MTEVDIAINGSIAKWERVLKAITEDGEDVDQGSTDCPLCKLFFHDGCLGCPISAFSGEPRCNKTPYLAWCNRPTPETALEMLNFVKRLKHA